MKYGDKPFSTGNVPDFGEHHYAAVNVDLQAASNHPTLVLKFPDSLAGKNSDDSSAPIYQTLISGVDAPIYQPLKKSPEFRAEKASKGVGASVYQPPNNGVAASIYETLNNIPKPPQA